MKFLLLSIAFIAWACRAEVAHGFAGSWAALPAEMHGEIQGMPGHWSVEGSGGAVSSANALATEAGIDILRRGGNAIDALLAVQWMLAVVEPQSSGLGGGGFLLYYEAKTKKVFALDGRETAPRGIDVSLFQDSKGAALPFKERIAGARPVGVPGTVALLAQAKVRFGSPKLTFSDTFTKAIAVARNGLRVSPRLSQAMGYSRDRLIAQNRGSTTYLKGDKQAYKVGEVLLQRDLADTLEILAREGHQIFYEGVIGRDIIATLRANSIYASSIDAHDLATYRVHERTPEQITLGDSRLFSVGAPASGRATLATIAGAGAIRTSDMELLARVLLAEKKAFTQREIELEDPQKENTTHVSLADSEGNIVSYTSSIEMSMGSAIEVRGRGFLLNSELTDFSPDSKKINGVAAGKRPKSSMSPLIMLKTDGSYVALGSPGGATIVGTNALIATRLLAGDNLADAILKPRAVQLPSGKAILELPLRRDASGMGYLKSRGVEIDLSRKIISIGSVQAIGFDARRKVFSAASDLRREGLGLVVNPVAD